MQGRVVICVGSARVWQLSLIMRALLLLLAACTEAGANLEFSAPNGPGSAAFYEVVLASPNTVAVAGQRVSPMGVSDESVTYYVQQTSANYGSLSNVDGFHVLVEPAGSATTFIPFVLLFDADQTIIGVGSYDGTIEVPRGKVFEYTIAVQPVTDVGDAAVGPGDAMSVTCTRDDMTTFRSGIVWRTADGTERRLMLPSDSGVDATARPLDLDCDGQLVATDASSEDCDDTRAQIYAGAAETCNGEDTNCDAGRFVAVPCMAGTTCGAATGTALCDQQTQQTSTCSTEVACACAIASTECHRCVIDFAHGTNTDVKLCEPALDAMVETNGACSQGCTVAVAGTTGGWSASVSATGAGPFAGTATGVTSAFALRVSRVDSSTQGTANASVGTVSVALQTTTGPRLVSFDLELADQIGTCQGTSPYAMVCN